MVRWEKVKGSMKAEIFRNARKEALNRVVVENVPFMTTAVISETQFMRRMAKGFFRFLR